VQPKPIARVQIALYADGRVQCGAEGSLSKATLARGLAVATQSLLNRLDEDAKEPGIEIPDHAMQKALVRP
jgi:hypothetical protein